FTPDEVRIFQQGNTLAKVIEANTNVTNLQPDVFIFATSISGHISLTSSMIGYGTCFGAPGEAGVTVSLYDSSGSLVTTTSTDAQGNYKFTGLNLDTYTVKATLPVGGKSTDFSRSVALTRGIAITGIDLGLQIDLRDHDPRGNPFGGDGGFGGFGGGDGWSHWFM
ncbi:MAG TPA: SdrD B-like domain-containing protein, partial [Pirellulales bacterium]|nr:SdrD B-like domain-containing protein [Pirellulales bacterium]